MTDFDFECPECFLKFNLQDVKEHVATMTEIILACPQCGEILKYCRPLEVAL